MTAPSSSPRSEKAGRPGAAWSTIVRWSGEEVVIDGSPWDADPAPRKPNRAARRAIARHNRRKTR